MSDQPLQERLAVHEAICAERYAGITRRLDVLTYILGALVLLLLIGEGTVLDVVKRLMGK